MTSQAGKKRRGCQRAIVAGALAAGAVAGMGAPTAVGDPATPISPTPIPATPIPATPAPAPNNAPPGQTMTADQALAIIDKDYDTGAGGGQVSNLIHTVLQLRAQGFKPSNANTQAIVAALDQRPNEEPLIEALKATLAYQHKLQSRQQNAKAPQQGVLGAGQIPPGQLPPGVPPQQQPGGINIPIPVG
jgi:hypothetical protein